jgi:hypothetical protein
MDGYLTSFDLFYLQLFSASLENTPCFLGAAFSAPASVVAKRVPPALSSRQMDL